MENKKAWYNYSQPNVFASVSTSVEINCFYSSVLLKALEDNKICHSYHIHGTKKTKLKTNTILKHIENNTQLKLVLIANERGCIHYLLSSITGVFELREIDKIFYIKMITSDINELNYIKKFCKKYINSNPPQKKDSVYTILSSSECLYLKKIGVAGIEYKEENYLPEVDEAYKHISQELTSQHPCGRLTIISGEPGTGKTYLIRSILKNNTDATFVLISPSLIPSIDGPGLLDVLVETKPPIVIVLEDADMCLVKRGADNMSAISALLNIGDGILGSLLDIRIIATTNAKKLDIDPAALRKGRVCTYLEVKKLDMERANNLFKKLTEKNKGVFGKDGATLAEVYSKAREYGWVPDSKETQPSFLNERDNFLKETFLY